MYTNYQEVFMGARHSVKGREGLGGLGTGAADTCGGRVNGTRRQAWRTDIPGGESLGLDFKTLCDSGMGVSPC